jgi:hypothetical protein
MILVRLASVLRIVDPLLAELVQKIISIMQARRADANATGASVIRKLVSLFQTHVLLEIENDKKATQGLGDHAQRKEIAWDNGEIRLITLAKPPSK